MIQDMFGNLSNMECQTIHVNAQFQNDGGQIVHVVSNEQNVPVQNTMSNVTQEKIDEMIFIMDSFNIGDKACHEIAQRVSSLPRMCNIKKRRHEPNSTFEIKTLESTGVYLIKSLAGHLAQTLGNPLNKHFSLDGTVKIKLSGDGTWAGPKTH